MNFDTLIPCAHGPMDPIASDGYCPDVLGPGHSGDFEYFHQNGQTAFKRAAGRQDTNLNAMNTLEMLVDAVAAITAADAAASAAEYVASAAEYVAAVAEDAAATDYAAAFEYTADDADVKYAAAEVDEGVDIWCDPSMPVSEYNAKIYSSADPKKLIGSTNLPELGPSFEITKMQITKMRSRSNSPVPPKRRRAETPSSATAPSPPARAGAVSRPPARAGAVSRPPARAGAPPRRKRTAPRPNWAAAPINELAVNACNARNACNAQAAATTRMITPELRQAISAFISSQPIKYCFECNSQEPGDDRVQIWGEVFELYSMERGSTDESIGRRRLVAAIGNAKKSIDPSAASAVEAMVIRDVAKLVVAIMVKVYKAVDTGLSVQQLAPCVVEAVDEASLPKPRAGALGGVVTFSLA